MTLMIKEIICEGTITRTLSNTVKSSIITIFGYISGILAQLMLYPLFGIQVDILAMLAIGLVFTGVAFISNYTAIKFIELLEKEKVIG